MQLIVGSLVAIIVMQILGFFVFFKLCKQLSVLLQGKHGVKKTIGSGKLSNINYIPHFFEQIMNSIVFILLSIFVLILAYDKALTELAAVVLIALIGAFILLSVFVTKNFNKTDAILSGNTRDE